MRSIRIQCTLNQIECLVWTGRPLVNLAEVLSYICNFVSVLIIILIITSKASLLVRSMA